MAVNNTVKPTGLFSGLSVSPTGGLSSTYSPSSPSTGLFKGISVAPDPYLTPKTTTPSTSLSGLGSNGNLYAGSSLFNGGTTTKQPTYSSSGGAIIPQYQPQTSQTVASTGSQNLTGNPNDLNSYFNAGQTGNPAAAPVLQTYTPPQQTQTTTQNQYQPNAGLYGQLTSGLASAATAGTAAGQQAQQATQQAAQGAYNTGSAQEQQAFTNAEQLRQQLLQSQLNEAGTIANNNSQPIPLEFQQGRNQIAQSQYAAQQAGYGSALQGESNLANIGLGSQGQGITGLGTAGNLANTAQQNTLTGLNNAAGLAAPILGQYGQNNYGIGGNAGGNLDPQTQATSLAQKVMSGQMTYDQAVQSLGYAGNVGTNFLNNAITGAGGNLTSLQAQGAATQSNIQTGGTAATSAAAQGLQQSTQAYVAANTAYTTAQQQAGNLQSVMASTGINSNPQFVNQKINALQNQLGSANYASFVTALNEARQAYTSLLSSVGASTPTVNGQQATDIFGANSTPAQINAAIEALNQAAYAKLKPMYDQIGTYQSQLGGGSNTSHVSGSIYNF